MESDDSTFIGKRRVRTIHIWDISTGAAAKPTVYKLDRLEVVKVGRCVEMN